MAFFIRIFAAALFLAAAASSTQAATIAAASCSQANVQTAVNSAVNGDTVTVPAGSCTWSSAVSISGKTITLQGAGSSGGTTITYGGTNHTLVAISAGSQTGKMDVSGFRFQGGDSGFYGGMHMSVTGPNAWRNVRIHGNVFANSINNSIRAASGTEGLIDHNTFTGSGHNIQFDGDGASDWTGGTPAPFGTAAFFFVEDNTFSSADDYGSTGRLAVDIMNGGSTVFRHNTLNNAFWENHDRCRSGLPSARAFEIYNNTFLKDSSGWKAVDLSCGDGVVYNNVFDTDWGNTIGAYNAGCNLPAQEVPGAIAPIYSWGNTRVGGAAANTINCTSSSVECAKMTFAAPGTQKPGYTAYTYPHPLQGGGAGDTTPPSVALTAPADSATVSGSISITATASDDVAVTGVQFLLDGANVDVEDTTAPYSATWNTTTALNGSHTLTARAHDAAGNQTTSAARTVTVANTFTGEETLFTAQVPATASDPDTASTELGVRFTAATAGEVRAIRFYKGASNTGTHVGTLWDGNGTAIASTTFQDETATGWQESRLSVPVNIAAGVTYTASYHAPNGGYAITSSFFSSPYANGVSLAAPASAGVYNYASVPTLPTLSYNSSNYFVDVVFAPATSGDTTPPTVALTAPSAGATVSGYIAVTATATDNVGVAGVQFKLDGVNLGAEDTAAPYSATWDTTTSTAGSHALTAVARDAAGNQATSSARTVTVSNPTGAPTPLPEGNTGIAAAYPNDANIAANALVLFTDDFETYTSPSQLTTRWNNYYQTANTRIATEQANVYTGAKSLEFTMPASGADVANEVVKNLSATQDTLFVRVYTKFSSGFDVTDPGHNGIRIETTTYPGPGQIPNGTDFFLFSLENSDYYNETQPGYTHVYAYHPEQRSQYGDHFYPDGKIIPFDLTPGEWGPYFVSRPNFIPQTNTWYAYEFMVKTNTPGQRDGRIAFWIDGVLKADWQNLRIRDVSTLKIGRIMLGLHALGNTAGADKKWYDNLVVAKSYIGPLTLEAPPPVDTTPPTVSLTAPSPSATVSGSVTLSASAADAVGVVGVQFKVDGINFAAEDTTAPYSATWGTQATPDGSHTVSAVARDAAGNSTTTPAITVTVNNLAASPCGP